MIKGYSITPYNLNMECYKELLLSKLKDTEYDKEKSSPDRY